MALYTTQVHTWHQSPSASENANGSPYLITTDTSLLLQHKHSFNKALASSQLYWAIELSEPELDAVIRSSVCFGLYHLLTQEVATDSESLPAATNVELVGMLRLVTDKATFVYMTDVYVLPAHERRGLGTWLVNCAKEWTGQMPSLRQLTLITSQGQKEAHYAKMLGTTTVEKHFGVDGARVYVKRGPGGKV